MSAEIVQYVEIEIPEFDRNAASFDGSVYLVRGAGLSGAADSTLLTCSLWTKNSSADPGATRLISLANSLAGGDSNIHDVRLGSNGQTLTIEFSNSADIVILSLSSSAMSFDEWHHVMFSFDLSDTGKRHIYIDDVSDLSVTTYIHDAIDFTKADWAIGAQPSGSGPHLGDMAYVWFMPGTYIDLSVEANRRLFINADGTPASLGSDGSTPTGTSPLIYLTGALAGWHTNKGTGGGFTVTNGALTEAVTEVPSVFRFAVDTLFLPKTIAAIPSLRDVKVSPAVISLGENLGQRTTITATFRDHRHVMDAEDYDSGTFWGKFRARYGLKLRGYPLRHIIGDSSQTSTDTMETRHYIIESTDGPDTKGEFRIIAKDILKAADSDRAQAPALSSGFLSADITSGATSLTLSPSGIGDEEYPLEGYAAIGGSEVVRFWRAQRETTNDSSVKVYLKMSGTDASTTFTDSNAGGSAKTWTAIAQAQIDTADFHIAPSSGLFDGTGDWVTTPDTGDFTLGTSDFAVDFWFKRNSTGAAAWFGQCDSVAIPTAASVSIVGRIVAGDFPNFDFGIGGVVTNITSSAAITDITTWHHILMNRSGSTFRLFVDGTLAGSASNAGSIQDSANAFRVGARGENTSSPWNGWIQHFRLSVSTARHTANFDPEDDYAVTATDTNDTLAISRAKFNTEAADHDAQDRVQVCLQYESEDVADIIYDLFTTYAEVDPSQITLANWQAETGSYLNTVYSALITEPKAVNKLVSELIEQAGLVMWWDDLAAQVRLQVIRAIPNNAQVFDGDNILMDTFAVKEQPEKRLSQIYFYFGQINPLTNEDQIDNYRSSARVVDEDAEAEYNGAVVKKIFSRWVAVGGRTVAETASENILSRFRDPPRRVNFEVLRNSLDHPAIGGGYLIGGWPLQDTDGAAIQIPVQVTSVGAQADVLAVEAEEMLFTASPSSPDHDEIVIDSNINNIDVETMHDSIFDVAVSGDTVTLTIQDGVIVGSTDAANPALIVGSFAVGVTVNVIVNGRIQGRGGNGAPGGQQAFASGSNPGNGRSGGTALYTRRAINLTSTNGEIWGGGGGGGGGGTSTDGSSFAIGGSGGGGGQGTTNSTGGPAGFGSTSTEVVGNAGTSEAAGAGGANAFAGGSGGTAGVAGSAGSSGSTRAGGSGGVAGAAIDGDSFVTDIGGVGSILGSQVN